MNALLPLSNTPSFSCISPVSQLHCALRFPGYTACLDIACFCCTVPHTRLSSAGELVTYFFILQLEREERGKTQPSNWHMESDLVACLLCKWNSCDFSSLRREVIILQTLREATVVIANYV